MHFHEYTSFPFRIQVFFGEICGWGKRKRTAREGDAQIPRRAAGFPLPLLPSAAFAVRIKKTPN